MACCALELAKHSLAVHPKDWAILFHYGSCLHAMARYPESLKILHQVARFCPPQALPLVYSEFGHLHRKRGAFRSAERWYRRAVDHSPSDATYKIFLGAILANAGRLQEAEAVYLRATRCKKGCIAEAHLNLGLVFRAQGRYTDACKCFQRALQLDPKCRTALTVLSDVEKVLELVDEM